MRHSEAPTPPGRRLGRRAGRQQPLTAQELASAARSPECPGCGAAQGIRHAGWCPVMRARLVQARPPVPADPPTWHIALVAVLFLASALFLMWCGGIRL